MGLSKDEAKIALQASHIFIYLAGKLGLSFDHVGRSSIYHPINPKVPYDVLKCHSKLSVLLLVVAKLTAFPAYPSGP